MATAWISMGSNLGDRGANLLEAVRRVASLDGVESPVRGPLRETAAVVLPGADPQNAYLNAAARFETRLDPPSLLGALLEIERSMGRLPAGDRAVWAPRTVDLDLLFCGRSAGSWADPPLVLPHPRWAERAFVLLPMMDIEPGLLEPVGGRSVRCLLRSLCPTGGSDAPRR